MSDNRVIRLVDPARGAILCAKSQGNAARTRSSKAISTPNTLECEGTG
jgi:hypothetical protein